PRRAPHAAHPHGVQPPRALHAQPEAGADPLPDLRARLGLRLRRDVQRSLGLHRLPAAQAGRGRRGTLAAHGAWRRLRPARRAMTFRARLTLYVAAAIAVTVAATSIAVWLVSKQELLGQFDQTLIQQAQQQSHPSPF